VTAGAEHGTPIAMIVQLCADHFGMRAADIRSARRDKPVALARHVAFYLARELTDSSFPAIGRCVGDRDHTSVMHGVRRMRRLIGTEPTMAARVSVLRGLAQQRMTRQGTPAPDGGIVEAQVICNGLLDGSVLPQTRAALLDLAIAALTEARRAYPHIEGDAS
jgi:hypothetical protein